MKSRSRLVRGALAAAAGLTVALCLAAPALADDRDPSKQRGAESAAREVTRDIGHATRDAAKAVGHATRDALRGIGHASRDLGKKLSE